jgi:hypothetical protein
MKRFGIASLRSRVKVLLSLNSEIRNTTTAQTSLLRLRFPGVQKGILADHLPPRRNRGRKAA